MPEVACPSPFFPAKAFVFGFMKGFMISALAGWPSHIKPDSMFAFIMQVNLWLPRDMEGVRDLVIGRCPGMNGFEELGVCTDIQRLPPSQVKGAGRPQGTRQNDMHKLMPGRPEWHTAASSEVEAELQLNVFPCRLSCTGTSMPGAVLRL